MPRASMTGTSTSLASATAGTALRVMMTHRPAARCRYGSHIVTWCDASKGHDV